MDATLSVINVKLMTLTDGVYLTYMNVARYMMQHQLWNFNYEHCIYTSGFLLVPQQHAFLMEFDQKVNLPLSIGD